MDFLKPFTDFEPAFQKSHMQIVYCLNHQATEACIFLRNESMLLTVIGYKCNGRIMFLPKCIMCDSKKSKVAN